MDEAVTYTLKLPSTLADVQVQGLGAQQRVEFHLTPADDQGINTRRLLFNNVTTLAVGDKAELPELHGLLVPAGSSGAISVAPVTIGFAVFPDAQAPATVTLSARLQEWLRQEKCALGFSTYTCVREGHRRGRGRRSLIGGARAAR